MDNNDTEMYLDYKPLAKHIASLDLMGHCDDKVKILFACCVAKFMEIFCPEPPYGSDVIVPTLYYILLQLKYLKDRSSILYKYSFQLLSIECKCSIFCAHLHFPREIDDDLPQHIIKLLFHLGGTSKDYSAKNKLLDTLGDYIKELLIKRKQEHIGFCSEIFKAVSEPTCQLQPDEAEFAENLIRRCEVTFTLPVRRSLMLYMIRGRSNSDDFLDGIDRFMLVKKLYQLCPKMLIGVFNNMEHCLNIDRPDHGVALDLLLQLMSGKDSQLTKEYPHLSFCVFKFITNWSSTMVQYAFTKNAHNLLVNQPTLREKMKSVFTALLREKNTLSPLTVVLGLASLRDPTILADEDFMMIMKRSLVLGQEAVRIDALKYLGQYYNVNWNSSESSIREVNKECLYLLLTHFSDRAKSLKEKKSIVAILSLWIVPYNLQLEEKLERWCKFWESISVGVQSKYHQIIKECSKLRKLVNDLISNVQNDGQLSEDEVILNKINYILDKSNRKKNRINSVLEPMITNSELVAKLKIILNEKAICSDKKAEADEILEVYEKQKCSKNEKELRKTLLVYLLQTNFDEEMLLVLLEFILYSSTNQSEEWREKAPIIDLVKINVEEQLELTFSSDVLRCIVDILNIEDFNYKYKFFVLLKMASEYKPLENEFPEIIKEQLIPLLKFIVFNSDDYKEIKHGLECLLAISDETKIEVSLELLKYAQKHLNAENEKFLTAIIILTELCEKKHPEIYVNVEKLVQSTKFQEIISSLPVEENFNEDWCDEFELPKRTVININVIHLWTKWALTSSYDVGINAMKTSLNNVIACDGDVNKSNRLCTAEKLWLITSIASDLLKLCNKYWSHFSLSDVIALSYPLYRDKERRATRILMNNLYENLNGSAQYPGEVFSLYAIGLHALKYDIREHYLKVFGAMFHNRRSSLIKSSSQDMVHFKRYVKENREYLPEYALPLLILTLVVHPMYKHRNFTAKLKSQTIVLKYFFKAVLWMSEVDIRMKLNLLNAILIAMENCTFSEYKDWNENMWALCEISEQLLQKHEYFNERTTVIDTAFLNSAYFTPTVLVHKQTYIPEDFELDIPDQNNKQSNPVKRKRKINNETANKQKTKRMRK